MNSDITAVAGSAAADCAALECLLLDGCHALEGYRAHPCEQHAEQLTHVHAALLAASADADADAQVCDDLLGVAGELEQALSAATRAAAYLPPRAFSSQRRGAA